MGQRLAKVQNFRIHNLNIVLTYTQRPAYVFNDSFGSYSANFTHFLGKLIAYNRQQLVFFLTQYASKHTSSVVVLVSYALKCISLCFAAVYY